MDLGVWTATETTRGEVGADVARASVIAHEFGHYVPSPTGVSQNDAPARAVSEAEDLRFTVSLELRADWHDGVWAAGAAGPAGQRRTRHSARANVLAKGPR